MGGHGGLNILPQKRWNVYNYENREKVRKDEEAAAREEQLKREQSRKRDSEFRLDLLRRARGLSPPSPSTENPGHINLFQGLEMEGFSSLSDPVHDPKARVGKKGDSKDERSGKRRKNEERPVAVAPEDEKYRMGYGVAGKGVKAPWYTMKPSGSLWDGEEREREREEEKSGKKKVTQTGKKTIEELREERRRREKREKERERAVMATAGRERDRSLSGDRKSRGSRFT